MIRIMYPSLRFSLCQCCGGSIKTVSMATVVLFEGKDGDLEMWSDLIACSPACLADLILNPKQRRDSTKGDV